MKFRPAKQIEARYHGKGFEDWAEDATEPQTASPELRVTSYYSDSCKDCMDEGFLGLLAPLRSDCQ